MDRKPRTFYTLSWVRDAPDDHRRIRIGEVRGFGLVQIAAFRGTLSDVDRAITLLLGGSLPISVGEARTIGARLLFKIGPEQFWIVTEEDDGLVGALESAIPPTIGAVTRLSHSRTRVFVEGAAARDVLSSGIGIDLHPASLPVGAFALTGVHHVPVLLHRTGIDRYELYVMCTFAAWVWDWLTDAALPSGYEVG